MSLTMFFFITKFHLYKYEYLQKFMKFDLHLHIKPPN